MANNLTLNDGTGSEKLKTKELTGDVHVPYSRLQFGDSDTEVSTSTDAGLPVQSIDGAIATLGAKADTYASTDTSVASLMAYIKRLCVKLTTISSQIGVAGGVTRSGLRPQPATAQGIAITSSTATQILAAPGSNYYLMINALVLANTSGSAERVTFTEGSGGTTKLEVYVPAGQTVSITLPAPIAIGNNTALYAKCASGVSTMYISAFGTVTT